MQAPKIVSRPAFTVVGLGLRGRPQELNFGALWDEFGARMGEIKGVINPRVAYGVEGNVDMASGEFDYLAAYEVAPNSPVPAGMTRWEVPAQTYAVFVTTLPVIKETWKEIVESWLPQSGRRYGPGPDFEFYPETFDPGQPGAELYLYVPIQ